MTEGNRFIRSIGLSARRTRRSWIAWGVGGAAGTIGVGVALWSDRRLERGDTGPGGSPTDTSQVGLSALWESSFARPDGGELRMTAFKAKILLVNFWATWCPPCVDEMPELDLFFNKQQPNGWQVVGLAIDQPTAVRTFLSKVPVRFPIGLAGLAGTEIMRQLGNSSGGLPFTVLVLPGGQIAQRKMGKTDLAELQRWASLVKK